MYKPITKLTKIAAPALLALLLIIPACKKTPDGQQEPVDPTQRSKIQEYLKAPKIQTVSFESFTGRVNMASLGNLKTILESARHPANGTQTKAVLGDGKLRYRVLVDSAKLKK